MKHYYYENAITMKTLALWKH